jgi:diketogulonate reductase-like aldo/keto reductase
MQTRGFGWTGVQVPLIGQGTWKIEGDSPAEALAALQVGLDAGMTHVDTAELYGSGKAESLVGRAIAGRRDFGAPALAVAAGLLGTVLTSMGDYPPRTNAIAATFLILVGALAALVRR